MASWSFLANQASIMESGYTLPKTAYAILRPNVRVEGPGKKPSVCRDARPNTTPKVTVVSMAWFEYWRGRPGFLRVGLGEFQLASLPSVSPSQTVRLPRARRPVSYSCQFRTR